MWDKNKMLRGIKQEKKKKKRNSMNTLKNEKRGRIKKDKWGLTSMTIMASALSLIRKTKEGISLGDWGARYYGGGGTN